MFYVKIHKLVLLGGEKKHMYTYNWLSTEIKYKANKSSW